MIRVIVIAVTLFSSFVIAGESMEELNKIIKNDQWAAAEGTHNDLPLLIRFRNKLTPTSGITNHPKLIQIFWDYSPHESGMPTPEESKSMEVFENRLVEALESNLSGVLTAVITTNGFREWVYYCKSTDVFAEHLHNMPQEVEPYPIEIEAGDDANWNYFFNQVRPE